MFYERGLHEDRNSLSIGGPKLHKPDRTIEWQNRRVYHWFDPRLWQKKSCPCLYYRRCNQVSKKGSRIKAPHGAWAGLHKKGCQNLLPRNPLGQRGGIRALSQTRLCRGSNPKRPLFPRNSWSPTRKEVILIYIYIKTTSARCMWGISIGWSEYS